MRTLASALWFCTCVASADAGAPGVVGAVIPQSGMHAEAAAGQARALALWAEQANAGGGQLDRPLALVLRIRGGRREIVSPEALARARPELPFPPREGRRRLE